MLARRQPGSQALTRRQPNSQQQSIRRYFGQGLSDFKNTLNQAGRGFATDIGGDLGTQAWNSYKPAYQIQTGERPSKRQKKVQKTLTGMAKRSFGRMGARRPMKRRRIVRRKASRPRRRMGGLKSMIKRIAIDSSEPKRFLFGTLTSFNGEMGVQALSLNGLSVFPINNLPAIPPVNQTDQNIVTSSWTGESYYMKGFRLTGQLSNVSFNFRVGVRMFVFKAEVVDTLFNVATNLEWYNPNQNANSVYANLPECFRGNPKFGRNVPYKMIYSKSWVLDRSALANGFNGTATDNVADVAAFDQYIKVNKTIRTKLKNGANQRGYSQYYVGFHWHKMDYDQTVPVVTDFVPNLALNGILYFRDP